MSSERTKRRQVLVLMIYWCSTMWRSHTCEHKDKNNQCVQFSSNSRKILEFWLLDDFPRILVDPRGSSRKFDSGSNSADLRVSSRKFDLGVVPSIACVTFMVYTNSAVEILLNIIRNPHFCRALRAHINAGFIRFPCFVVFSGNVVKL